MSDEFGRALRAAREAAGLSLVEGAAKIGISHPYLSQVERGERAPLSAEHIATAAEVLGANLDALLAARARARGVAEIPTDGSSPRLNELAIHLMICWADLTEEQARRIADVLHGGEG